ncbi:MAG: heavy-metal-associated domain-containing protein [Bacteroidales bacterium]|nr:heavy-metal-associated domain-containing protein [Bacteroidales bacterium]
MKKALFLAIALFMSVMANAKDIKTLIFSTQPEMHCQGCENRIKDALKYENGIKDIVTDRQKQVVTITYDADKISQDKIYDILKKTGYTCTEKPAEKKDE